MRVSDLFVPSKTFCVNSCHYKIADEHKPANAQCRRVGSLVNVQVTLYP